MTDSGSTDSETSSAATTKRSPRALWSELWRTRGPELLILLGAILLRLSLIVTYPVAEGYDFPSHWAYVEYVRENWALPPGDMNPATYQHPLWYFMAAGMSQLGLGPQAVGAFSVLCGCARQVLIFWGLERYLPESRLARIVALLVSALLPSSIHLDGMVQGEALNNLFSVAALLLAPTVLVGTLAQRFRGAAWLGVVMGVSLLTKASGVALVLAFGVAAAAELVLARDGGARGRLLRAAPWALCIGLVLAISGWYFARNHRLYGSFATTSFHLHQRLMMSPHEKVPYLERRSLGFLFGWSSSVYRWPYMPSGVEARKGATLFPVLVASTFADYYNFAFCAPPPRGEPDPIAANQRRGPRPAAFQLSRASVAGGTVVVVATVITWLATFVWLWRRRCVARLALLLAPLLALVGQIHFAIQYPIDDMGVIKSSYLQFAAPPLYALFGVGVAWLWSRRRGRPWAILCLGGFAPVAAYTLYCRVVLPLCDALARLLE